MATGEEKRQNQGLHIRNIACLATMDSNGSRFRGVDILTDGSRITAIGKGLDGASRKVIDAERHLVIPGLINTHHHLFQTLQRNLTVTQNAPLFQWLTELYKIWRFMDGDSIFFSTLLGCAELLKTGATTTTNHHYLYPTGLEEDPLEIQIRGARTLGIRFFPGRGSMSLSEKDGGLPPDSVVQDDATILADSERVIDAYHDPSPFSMTRIHLAPCAPFNVTESLMEKTAELARKKNVLLHTHLCETLDEETFCLKRYGVRPLDLMKRLGWTGPDVWYAHGIHFNEEERFELKETDTGISHCPTSNMRLGSGVARIPEMLGLGIRVSLAVDGSASNDSSDMLGEVRNCLLLQRSQKGPQVLTAEEVLGMATHGGASVLCWPQLGSIEVGKAADLAIFDLHQLQYAGALSDPLAAIVFSGYSHTTDYTIVNGKIIVENGRLTTFSEEEIIKNANQASEKMLRNAGIPPYKP